MTRKEVINGLFFFHARNIKNQSSWMKLRATSIGSKVLNAIDLLLKRGLEILFLIPLYLKFSHCDFVYFSFEFCQFLLYIFWNYVIRFILMSSLWIDSFVAMKYVIFFISSSNSCLNLFCLIWIQLCQLLYIHVCMVNLFLFFSFSNFLCWYI